MTLSWETTLGWDTERAVPLFAEFGRRQVLNGVFQVWAERLRKEAVETPILPPEEKIAHAYREFPLAVVRNSAIAAGWPKENRILADVYGLTKIDPHTGRLFPLHLTPMLDAQIYLDRDAELVPTNEFSFVSAFTDDQQEAIRQQKLEQDEAGFTFRIEDRQFFDM
jgi:hypothetical protein